MKLSDHDLRQLDEKVIRSLSPGTVENLAINLLDDLKESRERLNQNSQNSSKPPSSQAPWGKPSVHTDQDEPETDDENSEVLTAALQSDAETSSTDTDAEKSEKDEKESAPALKNKQDSSPGELTHQTGKQLGAQGFGRTQKIPVHKYQDITLQNVLLSSRFRHNCDEGARGLYGF